ncbi:MAG: 4-hydroxythreonine-4-phosphate dehydrogenase PdxA [Rugosibacter sp.]|jgi:4-hydroxythreonine-4-phosphate dehydrogenase|nr:4-phospho-D-threonate 3-dehydrogenase / 4-phospho-D-erythronate 3-dehydrogenase [Rugosibacter sp.]
MSNALKDRPAVGIVIGDPAGIGPEVIAKSWLTGKLHEACRPVLIGSAAAMERALGFIGKKASINVITDPSKVISDLADQVETLDILDTGRMQGDALPLGEDTAVGGRVSAEWLEEADQLARSGVFAATVMGPISTGSMKMAGTLDKVVSPTPGESYLLLISGPLRVAHVTDHIPLREVCDLLTKDLVAVTLRKLNAAMQSWGIAKPRIVVAGLNAHAMGREDKEQIAPAVEQARAEGIDATGPISPDTVFRQCIEGRYDIVLAMYHDQGHIAIKTWGFSGNSAIILGPPYTHLSVAHGTAFDIVGKNIADHTMMQSAIVTGAYLAAGRGFPAEK